MILRSSSRGYTQSAHLAYTDSGDGDSDGSADGADGAGMAVMPFDDDLDSELSDLASLGNEASIAVIVQPTTKRLKRAGELTTTPHRASGLEPFLSSRVVHLHRCCCYVHRWRECS